MAKKKKNRKLGSRFKRMPRSARLISAKAWILSYKEKNILRSYRKRYGVDWICAITELEMLGVSLDPEYVKIVKCSVIQRSLAKKRKAEEKDLFEFTEDQDEYFSYIAGYTSGGAAYGTPWESDMDDSPF